uniref:Fc receptor like 2 n=1 Tax=Prolemur simus TaxID=1328070 RepID=A0A8C9DEA8_PROSS
MLLWSLLIILAPASAQADGLTLLAPSSVFEGDRIVLSCQEEKKRKIKTMTYYKDETELLSLKKFSNFPIQRANFSDSGNYHCTATVGFWSWKETSQTVNIKVQEADGCRGDLVIARALGGLFGVLAFTGGVVLFYYWSHKISGKSSATNTPRGVSSPNPQASTQPSPLFAMEDLQPEYVNANNRKPSLENKDSQVIYSSVKK